MNAPVIIFVYKRLSHTKESLEALSNNFLAKESELYIFSDAGKRKDEEKSINEVRQYIKYFSEKKLFKKTTINLASEHKGLAKSIIEGVTTVMEKYRKAIVIEDDIITARDFLNFMNDALEFYEKKENIWAISGCTYQLPSLKDYDKDVYLSYRGESQSWGTWYNRWVKVDWEVSDYDEFMRDRKRKKEFQRGGDDLPRLLKLQKRGKIDSWAIRWDYQQYKQNMMTIYPKESFIENIGFDGTGVHSGKYDPYKSVMKKGVFDYNLINPSLEERIIKDFQKTFYIPMWKRVLLKLKEKMEEIIT